MHVDVREVLHDLSREIRGTMFLQATSKVSLFGVLKFTVRKL